MYHTRSISAPAWGTNPLTPTDLPPLASPRRSSRTTAATVGILPPSLLHLAPRPPLACTTPGFTDAPASAESSTFALFERQKAAERAVLRNLPAEQRLWDAVDISSGLAERRGRPALAIAMEECRMGCRGSCCEPGGRFQLLCTPAPGAFSAPRFPNIPSPPSSSSSPLLKPLPRPT
ncbi:hypothetical protein BDU57DRAFT_511105 [Ampelomyces quisqualis]|uniref:Uncharacterized protein n=1 Tax=Ampelomyces quisqualis TaxID=50730 RepID=A0A6A5R1P6_AMPQU|nr:hypothetical protein BDU57DRAFT_511105 [Ampelomyces quisqualis]